MRTVQLAVIASLASLLATASSTRAVIIPALSGSPTPNGANYDWTYNADIGADFRVQAGDFFTIYDFGLVAGHSEPAGWTFSTAPTGVNPFFVSPADDPVLANVTFTYVGSTPIIGASTLGPFTLTIDSNLTSDQVYYGAEATRNGGDLDGQFASDYSQLTGPLAPEVTPFPEPASIALLAIFAPLAVRRRRT